MGLQLQRLLLRQPPDERHPVGAPRVRATSVQPGRQRPGELVLRRPEARLQQRPEPVQPAGAVRRGRCSRRRGRRRARHGLVPRRCWRRRHRPQDLRQQAPAAAATAVLPSAGVQPGLWRRIPPAAVRSPAQQAQRRHGRRHGPRYWRCCRCGRSPARQDPQRELRCGRALDKADSFSRTTRTAVDTTVAVTTAAATTTASTTSTTTTTAKPARQGRASSVCPSPSSWVHVVPV